MYKSFRLILQSLTIFVANDSQIKPIIQLQNQRTVLLKERIGGVVVGVNDKEIGHGLVTPLQTAVDIKIIGLRVVLQERCPNQILGETKLRLRFDEVQQ